MPQFPQMQTPCWPNVGQVSRCQDEVELHRLEDPRQDTTVLSDRAGGNLPRLVAWPWLFAVLVILPIGTSGCRPTSSTSSDGGDGISELVRLERPAPEETLRAMVQAYQRAPAYSDRGEIRLTYRVGGRLRRDTANLALRFQRPGKLHLEAYQVELVSDGEKLQARVRDTGSDELDRQTVVRTVPNELSLPWLYEDHLLYEVLQRGLGRQPIQLELLLAERPIADFRTPTTQLRYLDDRQLQNHSCYRVEVLSEEGPFVFWIDRRLNLLRRLEYPTARLQALSAPREMVTDMRLVADFPDCQFAAPEHAFALEGLPGESRPLRRFVRPPQPLPSNLFGQTVPPLTLYQLDEQPVRSQQWRGKTVVLHWYVDHPACQASLELLEGVRRDWSERESDDVVFLAVNADASSTPNAALQRRMAEWGLGIPIVRDREAVGRDVFDIHALPALVILGPDGSVQLFEATYNPLLDQFLVEALQRISTGEDLGLAVVAQAHHDAVHYQKLLMAAATGPVVDEHSVSMITPSQPRQLPTKRLWSCSELSSPGNMVMIHPSGSDPRLWVLQGGQEIVELDQEGVVRSRQALPIAEDERLSLLRAATGSDGRHFVAVAEWGGQHVHLYNEHWERVWLAPPPDLRHEGILDVQLVDLQGDGLPEVCVLLAGAGLIAWDLSGQEVMRAETLAGVSLVGAAGGRRNWPDQEKMPAHVGKSAREAVVAAENGRVARVSTETAPEILDPHPSAAIFELFAGGPADGSSCYVGVSYDRDGQRKAYGLTGKWEETWSYRLPGGAHASPIQWAVPLPRLQGGEGGWCFATTEGSVHWVSDGGTFHDYFYPGRELTGLAVGFAQQGPLLIVASPGRIEAWVIDQP